MAGSGRLYRVLDIFFFFIFFFILTSVSCLLRARTGGWRQYRYVPPGTQSH
jgi:hypothetical protein